MLRPLRAVTYAGSFAVSKLAVYAAPIALAAIAPAPIYGAFELALAIAVFLATMLVSAPVHGLSHDYLLGEQKEPVGEVGTLIVLSCLVCIGLTAGGLLLGISDYWLLGLSMIGVAGAQITLSFAMRSIAVAHLFQPWIDGLALFFGFLIIGLLSLRAGVLDVPFIVGVFLTLTAAFGGILALRIAHRLRASAAGLVRAGTSGLGMAAYALLGTWVAVSGRLLFGVLFPEDVAAYGVAFRVSGLTMLVPSLIVIGLWKYFYACQPSDADRLIAGSALAIAILAAVVLLAGSWFIELATLHALDPAAREMCMALLPIVTIQCYFWGVHSLLQPLVNRSHAAKPLMMPLAALGIFGILAAYLARSWSYGAITLAWLVALLCAAHLVVTLAVLRRRHFALDRTFVAVFAGFAAIMAVKVIA